LILLGSWVILNSSTSACLQRTHYILDHATKNQRYGYELLAHYYSARKEFDDELDILMRIKPEDRTPRVYGKISQSLYKLERFDEAYEYARIGVSETIPNKLNALMAAITTFDREEWYKAIYYLRVALQMDPNDYQWLSKLGDALCKVDSVDVAINTYEHAISFNNHVSLPFFGLAHAHILKNDYERAEWFCREGLLRDPNSLDGKALWQEIQIHKK
jgi:tetratricopeptide (TPR) repeat protein